MRFDIYLHHDPAEMRRINARLDLLAELIGKTAEETRSFLMTIADDFNATLDKISAAAANISTELKAEADRIVTILQQNNIDPALLSSGLAKINSLADGMNAAVDAARVETSPPSTPTPPTT